MIASKTSKLLSYLFGQGSCQLASGRSQPIHIVKPGCQAQEIWHIKSARLACKAMTSPAGGVAHKLEARPSKVGGDDVLAPQTCSLPAAALSTEASSKYKDCSPAASALSAETLPLDFWDQPTDMDVEDDDWYNTMKHNPPRDLTLAYTDWMLGQKDGECHCQWVQCCGKWQHWTCNYHRWQEKK